MTPPDLLSQRRSTRHFSAAELPASVVAEVIAHARHTPSGGNDQPWQVTALTPPAARALRSAFEDRAWQALLPKLRRMVKRADPLAEDASLDARAWQHVDAHGRSRGAPWALLVHHEPEPTHLEGLNADARAMIGTTEPLVRRDSVVCYAYSLCLAATTRGLGSCMQSMYHPFATELFRSVGVPVQHELVSVVLLGEPEGERRMPARRDVPWRVVEAFGTTEYREP